MKINLRLSLYHFKRLIASYSLKHDIPFNQLRPIFALQKYLPHLPALVEQELHQAEPQVPLKSPCEHLALAFLLAKKSSQKIRQRYPQV